MSANDLEAAALHFLGGKHSVLDLLQRSGDAVEWALVHSHGEDDDMETSGHAVTACMQASVLLTGCGAWDLAAGMRALAAYFIALIEAERELQQTFGGAEP